MTDNLKEMIVGYDGLYESMLKCARGVRWKSTTGHYLHNWIAELDRMEKELRSDCYTFRKPKFFVVTEPKIRKIMSIHFRDRIYLRNLNDLGIYPQISRSLIPDNFACQKGKGTLKARGRLKEFLSGFYRKHKRCGYVLKIDIKGYYPNMDREYSKEMLKKYLDDETWNMALQALAHHPGDIGYNPGDQTIQNVGIAALDKIDHYIKERLRIKYYIRYMDDMILIHESRDYLEKCLELIKERLSAQKMDTHPAKTFIQPLSKKILFLGFEYRLTNTGKGLVFADPKKVKHERKKLLRMSRLVRKGEMTKRQVDEHFKCYKASVRYGNSHNLIYRLNRYYESLWEGESYGDNN